MSPPNIGHIVSLLKHYEYWPEALDDLKYSLCGEEDEGGADWLDILLFLIYFAFL